MKKILRTLYYIFTPLLLGSLTSILIKNSIDYPSLIKPPLSPPSIFFPIAWSIIYLLMGISYNLLKKEEYTLKESYYYYITLIANLFWPILFFYLKLRFLSIAWILLLDGLILHLIYLFWQKKKSSALLNIPYFLWSLFATYLTIGIYFLNY